MWRTLFKCPLLPYLCGKASHLMKNSRFVFAVFLCLCGFQACQQATSSHPLTYQSISGPTMGTSYNITYSDTTDRNLQKAIDLLLLEINLDVSTYIDTSVISKFNQAKAVFSLDSKLYASTFQETEDRHFRHNFGFASEVYKMTDGFFDPTVMPLVNYWGFGFTEKKAVTSVDSAVVDSLMQRVGFDKIKYESAGGSYALEKKEPGVQLDFSALAKGYAVDEIGRLLEHQGVQNYLVEIGGELRCKGKNQRGQWWEIGINTPTEDANLQELYSTISIQNRALATSGNYRNYYKVGETSYAHTINPKTGFPEKNILLSASVLAESCILADAYATAFMVMGLEPALILAKQLDGVEAYFIYSTEEGGLAAKNTNGITSFLH